MLAFWIGFIVVVLLLLWLDLAVFHRKSHEVSTREALLWTAFWVALGLAFAVAVYFIYEHHWAGFGLSRDPHYPHSGWQAAMLYLSGYLLEKSLSVDNMFVIAMIFTYFGVPAIYQHRVLFWGILGALVMRGAMIAAGTALVHYFTWATYLFGIILIITALKMLFSGDEDIEPDRNPLVRMARKLYPVTPEFHGPKFFVRHEGRRAITPLLLVLLVIESTDLLFALDSIPAVLAITFDPFLVFTSNVFAILGLRSLYFALAGLLGKFKYLKISLVVLLVFIGVKMLIVRWVHIEVEWSLLVIAGVLGLGIGASLIASYVANMPIVVRGAEDFGNLSRVAWRQIRRLVVLVVGGTVVLLGFVLFFTPGPAVVVIPLGLLILSTEFVWAKRLLDMFKDRIRQAVSGSSRRGSGSPADPAPPAEDERGQAPP